MRFNTLTRMADSLLLYKYIAKNVARKNGKTPSAMRACLRSTSAATTGTCRASHPS